MKYLLVCMICLFPLIGAAQTGRGKNEHPISIKVDVGHQKVGFPFRRPFEGAYHLYVNVGADRVWKEKDRHTSYQTLDISAFQNESSGSGYMIGSNYGHQYRVFDRLFVAGEAGIGMVHVFRPKETFELENGRYQRTKDWGKIHPAVNFVIQPMYQTGKIGFYLRYKIVAEFLYNDDAVVYPQTMFSLGLRYSL